MIGRPDFDAIARWVKPSSNVLDLGCGDGALIRYLRQARQVAGYGVEIADDNLLTCLKHGVNVIQMDLEAGLSTFGDESFDYVILSQTLQAVRHTEFIMKEMLRVGREGIVTFPNFGFWRHRIDIGMGHMPVSKALPYQWYDTPNVHLCTLADFEALCQRLNIEIVERVVLSDGRVVTRWPNLLGEMAVYRCRQH